MTLSSRMIIVLTCVGLLSGGFLTGVGLITKDRIAHNKQMEIEEAITAVVPMTSTSEVLHEEKDLTVYGGKDESGNLTLKQETIPPMPEELKKIIEEGA